MNNDTALALFIVCAAPVGDTRGTRDANASSYHQRIHHITYCKRSAVRALLYWN